MREKEVREGEETWPRPQPRDERGGVPEGDRFDLPREDFRELLVACPAAGGVSEGGAL